MFYRLKDLLPAGGSSNSEKNSILEGKEESLLVLGPSRQGIVLMGSCIFAQSSAQDPSGICRRCGKCKTLWQRGVGKAQDGGFCRVITLSWMWREHRGHSQAGKLEEVLKCGGCGTPTVLSVGIWV